MQVPAEFCCWRIDGHRHCDRGLVDIEVPTTTILLESLPALIAQRNSSRVGLSGHEYIEIILLPGPRLEPRRSIDFPGNVLANIEPLERGIRYLVGEFCIRCVF